MSTPQVLSDREKILVHENLRGWPTDEHLRRVTAGWPVAWLDESIRAAPGVADWDALPGLISTLRELRAERTPVKFPFGMGVLLRNFPGKIPPRRKVSRV